MKTENRTTLIFIAFVPQKKIGRKLNKALVR